MAAFRTYRAAFPDLRCVLEDVFASDDRVVVRGLWTGTHQGPFVDMPATAKRIDVPFIDIMRMGTTGSATSTGRPGHPRDDATARRGAEAPAR